MVYINLPYPEVVEGSGFTFTAYFRDGTSASTPTNAKYRIDCLTSGKEILDWTSMTPASSINTQVTGTQNAIQSENNSYEIKQITVTEDADLSTQTRNTAYYKVKNIKGF